MFIKNKRNSLTLTHTTQDKQNRNRGWYSYCSSLFLPLSIDTTGGEVNNNTTMAPQHLTFVNTLFILSLFSLLYLISSPSFFTSPTLHLQHLESSSPSTTTTTKSNFELCPSNYTNYCPCEDPKRQKLFPNRKWFRKERHCPKSNERLRCLIPIPVGYQKPFPWPQSKNSAWLSNVPFTKLVEYKKSQNWVRLEGDRFVFPGGGTSFPEGVKGYVDALNCLLPVPLKSGHIRTALDVGCGVSNCLSVIVALSFFFWFYCVLNILVYVIYWSM